MASSAAARRRAMREIREGAEPTFERLASISGLRPASIRRMATKDKWKTPDEVLDDAERGARLQRVKDWCIRALEQMQALAAAEKPVTRQAVDQVSAMVRLAERLSEPGQAEMAARGTQVERDEEMAGILQRVDERIVELAGEYARHLVSGNVRSRAGKARRK